MKIRILNYRWIYKNMIGIQPSEVGLGNPSKDGGFVYEVKDVKLFFLSVIKYGLEFKQV
jgi:hypothetical protein